MYNAKFASCSAASGGKKIQKQINHGDKCILPQSALETMLNLEVVFPLFCRLVASRSGMTVSCSVLEFTAPEGSIYIPDWIHTYLELNEGEEIELETVELEAGVHAVLKLGSNFNKDSHKETLEYYLRKFSTLTKGAKIQLLNGDKEYDIEVIDLTPADSCFILNIDLRIDLVLNNAEETACVQREDTLDNITDELEPKSTGCSAIGIAEQVTQNIDGSQQCRNCDRYVPSTNYLLHEMSCARLNYRCEKCGKVVKQQDKEMHFSSTHALMRCPKCAEEFEIHQLCQHNSHRCQFRLKSCAYCKIDITFKKLRTHEAYCGSRTEKCESCGKFILLHHMQLHMDSNCINEVEELRSSLYICPVCSTSFRKLQQILDHTTEMHGGEDNKEKLRVSADFDLFGSAEEKDLLKPKPNEPPTESAQEDVNNINCNEHQSEEISNTATNANPNSDNAERESAESTGTATAIPMISPFDADVSGDITTNHTERNENKSTQVACNQMIADDPSGVSDCIESVSEVLIQELNSSTDCSRLHLPEHTAPSSLRKSVTDEVPPTCTQKDRNLRNSFN